MLLNSGTGTAMLKLFGWSTRMPISLPFASIFRTQTAPGACALETDTTLIDHSRLKTTTAITTNHRRCSPSTLFLIALLPHGLLRCPPPSASGHNPACLSGLSLPAGPCCHTVGGTRQHHD